MTIKGNIFLKVLIIFTFFSKKYENMYVKYQKLEKAITSQQTSHFGQLLKFISTFIEYAYKITKYMKIKLVKTYFITKLKNGFILNFLSSTWFFVGNSIKQIIGVISDNENIAQFEEKSFKKFQSKSKSSLIESIAKFHRAKSSHHNTKPKINTFAVLQKY
jgi:hypothetical protein